MELFRKEAIEHQRQRLLGDVVLHHSIPIQVSLLISLLLIVLSFVFLFNFEYLEKETVQGYITTNKDNITVYSNITGVVRDIYVNDGDFIKKNAPLAKIEVIENEILNENPEKREWIREGKYSNKESDVDNSSSAILTKYVTLKSPSSGMVTEIDTIKDQNKALGSKILTIIPDDSNLIAELLVPTQSSGFLKISQKVILRIDAFPYQQYGTLSGKIYYIDPLPTRPSDEKFPISINGSVYKVRCNIVKKNSRLVDKGYSLKRDMLLNADIIQGKKKLYNI